MYIIKNEFLKNYLVNLINIVEKLVYKIIKNRF